MMMNNNVEVKMGTGKVIDRVKMMEGYMEMAAINLEEANCCTHTYNDGMELYEGSK